MRIVLFGIPEFGTIFIEMLMNAKKNVVAIVLPPKNHAAYRSMKMVAKEHKIPAITLEKSLKEPHVAKEIKSYKPDVILISAYPRLIPPEIYNIPPLGTINCHPSLLPDYRGANPYFHVLRNGEQRTGITFHYVDDTYDTGDVISQWMVPILPNETLGTLYLRLSFKSSELYFDIIDKLEKGETLPRNPQPKDMENLKTAPEVKMGDPLIKINWKESARNIDSLVRACNPYFGAVAFYRNMPMKIWTTSYNEKPLIKPSQTPGTIIKVTNSEMAISTGQGICYPLCVQHGMLYTCDIKEFINRNNPKVGEILK